MADNKMGPNLQAGAGFLAKRVQKSLSRAQEKVLQKLGKNMETKDEQFELCFQNLNKQQIDGNRLFKDVRAYYTAVKAVHETSRRLSQTLKDIYESDWDGVEDLAVITESENLLLSDYEEKLNDQIVRTMENYTSQFPEVKERVSKRGRKLVDYDSARHHLEALQNAKKKDEVKIAKAEEEFNKAQNVFEEINNELREELPILYQSRIGCYVTVFQNISNLRDVFYKEMSVLNHELYNVMKKLETQHSGKAFVIKGLNSTSGKSKKRTSLVISNPIPCNTAFPDDHVSIHSSTQNDKEAAPSPLAQRTQSIAEENGTSEESGVPSESFSSSESELSLNSGNTPKRQSVCDDHEGSDESAHSQSLEEAGAHSRSLEEAGAHSRSLEEAGAHSRSLEEAGAHSRSLEEAGAHSQSLEEADAKQDRDQSDDSSTGATKSDATDQELTGPPESLDGDTTHGLDQVIEHNSSSKEVKSKPAPVPAPRLSFHATAGLPVLPTEKEEKTETDFVNLETSESRDDFNFHKPAGFLYKGVAIESHEASEDGQLQFEQGDIILVLADTQEVEGLLKGIREENWNQYQDVKNHSGIFSENLIRPMQEE